MRCWLCTGYKYLVYLFLSNLLKLKFWVLSDYYGRLAVQAKYLYRSSQLFKDRWQQMGLDYAEQSFVDDFGGIGRYFFWKAQHGPWTIKKEIILDSIFGRSARPYVLSDSGT